MFYRLYTVNIKINPFVKSTKSFVVENIIKIQLKTVELRQYKSVYKLENAYEIPDVKFVNLTQISFEKNFNCSVDALNNLFNIESIMFGTDFNQRVDNLPSRF
jgi:hypothetical protein